LDCDLGLSPLTNVMPIRRGLGGQIARAYDRLACRRLCRSRPGTRRGRIATAASTSASSPFVAATTPSASANAALWPDANVRLGHELLVGRRVYRRLCGQDRSCARMSVGFRRHTGSLSPHDPFGGGDEYEVGNEMGSRPYRNRIDDGGAGHARRVHGAEHDPR
jgi:hypothetical protein